MVVGHCGQCYWVLLLVVGSFVCHSTPVPSCNPDPSQVNDNYCDCLDGTDEPLTEACGGRGGAYQCSDGTLVPTSRLHDGVCDCCDGADEPVDVCPNHCAASRSEEVVRLEARRADLVTLLQQRKDDFEAPAAACVAELQERAGHAREHFQHAQEAMQAARQQDDYNAFMRAQHQAGMLHSMLQTLQPMATQSDKVFGEDLAMCTLVGKCWTFVMNEKYFRGGCAEPEPHDFNFTVCPFTAVHQQQVWVPPPPKEDPTQVVGDADAAAAASSPPTGEQGETSPPPPAEEPGPPEPVLLGRWTGFVEGPDPEAFPALFYSDGAQCWAGPDRTVTVNLQCGSSGILDVRENGKCTYEVDLATPSVCRPQHLEDVERRLAALRPPVQ